MGVIERHKTEKQLSEEGSPFPSLGRSLSSVGKSCTTNILFKTFLGNIKTKWSCILQITCTAISVFSLSVLSCCYDFIEEKGNCNFLCRQRFLFFEYYKHPTKSAELSSFIHY